jgi:hypothetical protein
VEGSELRLQQRLPEDRVGAPPADLHQPLLGADAVQVVRVREARGVDHRRRQPALVHEGQEREAQEVGVAVHVVHPAAGVVPGAGARPAQVLLEAEVREQPDERRVLGQDAVVEAVPGEGAVVVRRREPSERRLRLEHINLMPCGRETVREGETEDPAADDGGLHGAETIGAVGASRRPSNR